jgi:membrane fusion protein, multidrug efflux system
VEVDVPNPDGALMPGMYGQVHLHCKHVAPTVILPTSAISFGSDGPTVAVLDGEHVRLRRVALGRDFGPEVEIITGLSPNEKIANNPGSLVDGAIVTLPTKTTNK